MNDRRFLNGRTVVSLTLTSALLAGCGSGGAPSSSGGSAPNETAAQTGPLEISVLAPLWNELPEMTNAIFTEIQTRTNTKFNVQWIPISEFASKLELALASGDLPDIIAASDAKHMSLLNSARQGVFWELTPILGDFSAYPNMKKALPDGVLEFLKVDGKLFSLPRTRPPIDVTTLIRKDWLDKFNLPEPATMDEFHETLKTIVHGDPDGNGKPDTIGIDFSEDYGGAFGTFEPEYNSEGGLIFPRLTRAYGDFVEFYRKLYADGLVAKEFSLIKSNQYEDMFKSGKLASYARTPNNGWTFQQEIKKTQPEAAVTALVPLQGPKGHAANNTLGYAGALYFPKKVSEDKLKRILQFLDQTSTPEISDLFYNGIPDVHHTLVDGQVQFTELGRREINITTAQFVVLYPDRWMKVNNPSAPKAFNDELKKKLEVVEQVGKYRIHEVITSEKWLKEWPKYSQEWESMRTKAIIGQIGMDEYRAYVDKLNNMTEFKAAYQEFAKDYQNYKWK